MQKLFRRDEIQSAYYWDLSTLFSSDEKWHTEYKRLNEKIAGYEKYIGCLHQSILVFKDAIEFDLSISRTLDRIFAYAHLRNDEDRTNIQYNELYQMAVSLRTRIFEQRSFFWSEILAVSERAAQGYLNHPELTDYRFYLEKKFRRIPHTRSHGIETLLAMTNDLQHAPYAIFSQLENADLTFGSVQNKENIICELTHGNFLSFLYSEDRLLRKTVFNQYFGTYNDHKHTIAACLVASVQKDCLRAKVRRFKHARQQALFSDNVSLSVYDNLIDTIKASVPQLLTYLVLRKETLGIKDLHYYDLYVPLVPDVHFNLTFEESVDICLQSLKPLGDDYCKILRNGLLGGWVDRYENKGKLNGAYSSGCYDSDPYILMNYKDENLNSLYTLIHEAGHAMHSYYCRKEQPYHYSGHSLLVAEVASQLNEILLSHYLFQYYRDNVPRLAYIINREIDSLRSILYRQTMFAEFEKNMHETVERGEPLTLECMQREYRELLQAYFGGELCIDGLLELEFLKITNFYRAFYAYMYAIGISAAIVLAQKILSSDSNATDAYLSFLKLGDSVFPTDALRQAGVNICSPEPIKNALSRFAGLVDKLYRLL